jgi:collagen type VI alpha
MSVIKSTVLLALCLSCVIFNVTKAADEPETVIVCKADVVFCVDNSGSIRDSEVNGENNWQKVLDFLVALAERLSISQDGTQVGLVTFGNKAYMEFDLNKYQIEPEVTTAIKNLRYRGENTNTTGGMQLARTILTTQSNGARAGIPKVLILITDGIPTFDADKLPQEVALIKSAGIRIVTVGVTNQVNETLLKSIASTPQDYVYGNDFSGLQYIKDAVINNNTCQPVPITTTPTTTTPTTTTRTTTPTTTPTTTTPTTTTPTTTTPTTTTPTAPPVTKACNSGADIVILLDASGSIGYNNFNLLKEYLVKIVEQLEVDNGKIRVGLLTFSSTANLQFNLNKYTDRLTMFGAIRNTSYPSGSTSNTAAAINYARTNMFTTANGDRSDVANTIVIITDGASDNQNMTLAEATLAKNAKIRVVALGVGNWLNMYEFQSMVSYPYQENTVIVPNFAGLTQSAEDDLHNTICSNSGACASNPCRGGTCTPGKTGYRCDCSNGQSGELCQLTCNQIADVVFLVDASGSYGPDNFQKQLNSVRDTIQSMNIVTGGSRVALISVSTNAVLHFRLDQYSSKQDILDACSIQYSGGSTNMAAGLQAMQAEFTARNRTNVAKIGIVMTDGRSDDVNATTKQAELVRLAGITLVVVAVGNQTYVPELSAIVSNPSAQNMLNVSNYDSFATIKTPLQTILCNDANECDSNPCRNEATCVNGINGYTCKCKPGYTGINCERACSGRVDIAFVLDASGSIRVERFPIVIDTVVSIVEQLQVSMDDTRIAAVSYSDNYVHQFFLNRYSTKQDIQLALRRIQFIGGRTNTASGIEYMKDQIFTAANGDRADAPNFAIVLSDGNSNINQQNTIPMAVQSRNKDITMIAFAVGTDVNLFELRNIASEPYNQTIFNVMSSVDLPKIVTPIVKAVCDDVNECASSPCQNGGSCLRQPQMYQCNCPQPFAGERCERRCPVQLDVTFVLDLSGSVEEVYEVVIQFAKRAILGLPVGSSQVRVAVVTFADMANITFDLSVYSSSLTIRNALAFSRAAGATNTQEAIRLTSQEIFTQARGDRSGVKNVIVIVTDGKSTVQPQNTISQANTAKQQGIEIYSIGIGPDVNPAEIDAMASTPTQGHTVYVKSPSDVDTGAKTLLDLLCQQ